MSLLSKVSKQCFFFGHFWLFSQNNQPILDLKFKNDWTKSLQKLPRKINVSLSLAYKRKLTEKNEWKLSNQSSEVMHASICLTNCRKCFFFQLTKFRCSENIGDIPVAYPWWSAILLKLQSFIPEFNQFHPVCYYHIASLTCYIWIYV